MSEIAAVRARPGERARKRKLKSKRRKKKKAREVLVLLHYRP